ncbi:ankyrin repeat domain-containing protein 34B isoform X2 [Acanthochromis polyacanthus]|nr:ankyrin repeat domain-containing protein 34B isoform X2 [Acanthochromis polyacanthus]XP_051812716.1 ankyrin repeat domain-containing protein 34B isoform X2 [Acanthochromis polyacanthus]
MVDPLSDCSPLISAASSGKLRLVRLLVEGGAQVNRHNPGGETPLLAACKALRGEPAGPTTMRLLTYLLQNKADPNAQDKAGRTALMYACMERAGAEVASTLLAAGADPSMEDYSGASALVYAINAQHQPTVKVLMDACRARGRDIIIIATETGVNGGSVTRRYLNVPPSPDTSPVSCMSPSDIFLKTGSPNSPEGENIFNFRGTSRYGSSSRSRLPSSELSPLSQCSSPSPRQRILSEPWLAIHNLACLNRAYDKGTRERSPLEEGGREEDEKDEDEGSHQPRDNRHEEENYSSYREDFSLRASQSVLSLTEMNSAHVKSSILRRCPTPGGANSDNKLPAFPPFNPQLRRNTLPSVTVVPPLLHLPPLEAHLQVPTQASPSRSRRMVFLPHPPSSSPPSSSSSSRARPALLPPLPLSSSVTSLVAPSTSRKPQRRHSMQLEQITGGAQRNPSDL